MSRLSRTMALAAATCLPLQAAAAPVSLSLAQASANTDVMSLPVCSDTVTSNCRRLGSNMTWIIVPLVLAGGILAAVGSSGKPASP